MLRTVSDALSPARREVSRFALHSECIKEGAGKKTGNRLRREDPSILADCETVPSIMTVLDVCQAASSAVRHISVN